MSKEGTSKIAAVAGFALTVGAAFALVPFIRKAWARLMLRAKPPSDEASPGKGTGANGAPAEDTQRAKEGSEAAELGRAENEGMHRPLVKKTLPGPESSVPLAPAVRVGDAQATRFAELGCIVGPFRTTLTENLANRRRRRPHARRGDKARARASSREQRNNCFLLFTGARAGESTWGMRSMSSIDSTWRRDVRTLHAS